MFPQPVVPFIREAHVAIRKPWYTPPRRLLDYLLLVVEEGRCLVEVEGAEAIFEPGDICLIQPDRLHSLRGLTNTTTPYAHLDLFYNPRRDEGFPTKGGQVNLASFNYLMQPRLDDLGWITVPVKVAPAHPAQFRTALKKMVELWQGGDELGRLEANHLATELILSIFKQYGRVQWPAPDRPHSLSWVPAYLSFHISEPLTVVDMARRAHLSPSRFAAVFRQQFGLPPHRYLLRLRIEYAMELLRNTDLPLREIADACGFVDEHHFSKAFKRIVQVSPGVYRRVLPDVPSRF